VSFADGGEREPTGRLLFYLTAFDASAQDAAANASASLTLCELQLPGACLGKDPQARAPARRPLAPAGMVESGCGGSSAAQDPSCAKASLTGELLPVPRAGRAEAARLLFSRHPAMRGWPASHGFTLYELHVASVRLLDSFGGAQDVSASDYYAAGSELWRATA